MPRSGDVYSVVEMHVHTMNVFCAFNHAVLFTNINIFRILSNKVMILLQACSSTF